MHGRADGGRRNENVPTQPGLQLFIERACLGNDEAISVTVHGQAADHHVLADLGLRQGVAV